MKFHVESPNVLAAAAAACVAAAVAATEVAAAAERAVAGGVGARTVVMARVDLEVKALYAVAASLLAAAPADSFAAVLIVAVAATAASAAAAVETGPSPAVSNSYLNSFNETFSGSVVVERHAHSNDEGKLSRNGLKRRLHTQRAGDESPNGLSTKR